MAKDNIYLVSWFERPHNLKSYEKSQIKIRNRHKHPSSNTFGYLSKANIIWRWLDIFESYFLEIIKTKFPTLKVYCLHNLIAQWEDHSMWNMWKEFGEGEGYDQTTLYKTLKE